MPRRSKAQMPNAAGPRNAASSTERRPKSSSVALREIPYAATRRNRLARLRGLAAASTCGTRSDASLLAMGSRSSRCGSKPDACPGEQLEEANLAHDPGPTAALCQCPQRSVVRGRDHLPGFTKAQILGKAERCRCERGPDTVSPFFQRHIAMTEVGCVRRHGKRDQENVGPQPLGHPDEPDHPSPAPSQETMPARID